MTGTAPPPDRRLLRPWTLGILALVLAAAAAAAVALLRVGGRDRKPAAIDEAFVYDVERYRVIPPGRIGYRETARFPTGLGKPSAIAVGPEGRIAAGGDGRIQIHSADGELLAAIPAPGRIFALSASPRGDLLAGTADRVARCPWEAPLTFFAAVPGENPRITSIAADADSVFVADAGARLVWRFAPDGQVLGRIGERDPDRNVPGFSIPSPYFDLLVAPDGLLRVVDPGRRRIDAFTARGDLEFSWGHASYELEGFSGCCNPSHIAMLPDGRFVTSEKGIPRVKVHGADGAFVTAVVGAGGLDTAVGPCDVAVGPGGRIVLLDPGQGMVRVFEPEEGPANGD